MNSIFFSVVFFAAGTGQLVKPPVATRQDRQELERKFQEADRQLQLFRERHRAGQFPMGPDEQLKTLESVVTELELDVLGKEALWTQLKALPLTQFPITPELQAILATDPKLATYRRELSELEDGVRRLKEQVGDEHRGVRQDEDLVEQARKRIDEEAALKAVTFASQQIVQAQQIYLRSQEMLLKAKDQLTRARAEQRVRDSNLAEYLRLLEAREVLRGQLSVQNDAARSADRPKADIAELKCAVQKARAALDQAQMAHGKAVRELEEALAATQPAGSADGLDNGNQAESRPVRESGN